MPRRRNAVHFNSQWERKVPVTFRERVGAAVQHRRIYLGLSQVAVAKELLISHCYYARLERGLGKHTLAYIEDVCACLQIDPFELFAKAALLGDGPVEIPPGPPKLKAYDLTCLGELSLTLRASAKLLRKMDKSICKRVEECREEYELPEFPRPKSIPHVLTQVSAITYTNTYQKKRKDNDNGGRSEH
jgi:transcriptional regulator with XRE-family HTH domain